MKPPPLPPTAAVQVKRSRPPVAAPAAPSPIRPKAIRQTSADYNPPPEQPAASATPAPVAIPTPSEKSGAASDVDNLASAIKRITLKVSSRDEHDRKQKRREEAEKKKKKKAQGVPAAAKKAGSSGSAKTLAVRKSPAKLNVQDLAAETPSAAADPLQYDYSVDGAAVDYRLGDGARRISGTRGREMQQRASSDGMLDVVAPSSVPDSVMSN
ncbi:hypothetical protein LTR28_002804, partial [Elasticomyces elasticus]